MKRVLVLLVAVAALTAVAVPAASLATTAPAFNFPVHVVITNKNVILDRERAKRGWLAHFVIRNRSSKPIRFEIGGLKSKLIKPGKTGKLGAYLEQRGQYKYDVNKKFEGFFNVV